MSDDFMENVPPRNISQLAREMQQRSAKAIKGTPAARKRAVKAGKYSWSKRIKEAFVAGFQMASEQRGLIGVELAWEIWQRGQVTKKVPGRPHNEQTQSWPLGFIQDVKTKHQVPP